MEHVTCEEELATGATRDAATARPKKARRSRKHRRIEPYAWLAAGAVGVGIAAAMTGAGIASAEDTGSSTATGSSTGATSGPAKSSSSSADSPSRVERTDRIEHRATGDSSRRTDTGTNTHADSSGDPGSTNAQTGTDVDSADDATDSDSADNATEVDSADEVAPATDIETPEAPTAPQQVPAVRSSSAKRTTAQPDISDTDKATTSPKDVAEAQIDVPEAKGPEVEDSVLADTAASFHPISSAAELDSATVAVAVDIPVATTSPSTTQAPEIATQSLASPAAAATPTTLAELLRTLFQNFQRTYFNRTPTARPVQHPGQSSKGEVSGTIGAHDADGDPLAVELAAGPERGSVRVDADGNYVYTPSPELAAGGGTDAFTVVVRETNADSHTHGFKGMWSKMVRSMSGGAVTPDDGSTITQVVSVTIAKQAVGEDESQKPPVEDESPTGPRKYDSGLKDPFQVADAPSGRTLNVRDFGATSERSSDNDAVAIQKAIDAAQAGDTVYIPNGTYHIKSTIGLKSGVSLIGESRQSTVLATAFSMFSNPYAVIYAGPGVTNLNISSFTIDQASGKLYHTGVHLGSEAGGQVSRIVVKDLAIERHRRFGIMLQNADNVLVDGNVIKNASALDGGGSGYGVIIDQAGSFNNWVRNNTIGPVIRHGILIQEYAHHNLIELNTITGTVSGGIDLHGEDEYSNEIRYNTIANGVRNGTSVSPNGAGIEVGEYSGVIGTDTMHDNTGPYNWIHHNVVYNYSAGLGITNNSNHTYIEDNIFYNNDRAGIEAVHAPLADLYIARNTIYGNRDGIVLNDVVNAVLEGNTVRDNRDHGIWTNAGVVDYRLVGNILSNNGTDMLLGNSRGTVVPSDT